MPFTVLTAVLYAPIFFWVATVDFESVETLDQLHARTFIWPMYGLTAVATLLAPMLTYRVVQDLNGVKVSMLTSMKHGVRGFLPAFILAAVVNVLQLIPTGGGILSTIILCIWFVASPAAVAEKLGPFAALQRSAVLTGGRRWGIFGMNFLVGIVLLALLFAWIWPMFEHPDADILDKVRTTALVFIGIAGLMHMFMGIVSAVSYVLLRQDKDGVSHAQLARVFE